MNRAIKIRLYPNLEQKEQSDKTFGCCRLEKLNKIQGVKKEKLVEVYTCCPRCGGETESYVNMV